jgi:purine-binding chemotaxis protein CheW
VCAALHHFEQEVGANIQEDQRIIVVDVQGFALGLVVDRVNEVMNVTSNLLAPPPVANSREGVKLEAVAKLNGGNRLIMLLDAAGLIKDRKTNDGRSESVPAASAESSTNASREADLALRSNEVQLVTFMLGDEEYGVPISTLKEIDRLAKITKIPNAARFVEGVTNLRGEVIPVLDTRKRFGLEATEYNDRTRLIVVEQNGTKTALVVDSVREVLRLSNSDIAPPPESIQSGIDQKFIAGIGKVEPGNRMVVLLDVEKIVTTGDRTESDEIHSL